jgi:hypothetical protein
MLSREDNELLCRVGPGTPMGALLRQYWLPALPSALLPEGESWITATEKARQSDAGMPIAWVPFVS